MKKAKRPLSALLCALLLLPLLLLGSIHASAAEFEVNVTYTPDIYGAYFRATYSPTNLGTVTYSWLFYDAAVAAEEALFSHTPASNPSTLYLESDVLRNELVPGKTYNVVCRITSSRTGTTEASAPYSYTDRLKRGALKRTIDDLKDKDLSSFSAASKNAFNQALQAAQAVYQKDDVQTSQQEINKARTDLIAANAALSGNIQTVMSNIFASLRRTALGTVLVVLIGPFIAFIVVVIMLLFG